jgi:hypothetical protein
MAPQRRNSWLLVSAIIACARVAHSSSALISFIAQWNRELDVDAQDLTADLLASKDAQIRNILANAISPDDLCSALYVTAGFSNVLAMRRILSVMSPADTAKCALLYDASGVTLVHRACASHSTGLARIAAHAHTHNASLVPVFIRALGLRCLPDPQSGPPGACSSGECTVGSSKAALEACTTAAPLRMLLGALASAEATVPGTLVGALTRLCRLSASFVAEGASSLPPTRYLGTPLGHACAAGNVKAVELLLAAGGSDAVRSGVWAAERALNGVAASCAHLAASRGYVDVLDALASGIPVPSLSDALGQLDSFGRTPLDAAELAGPAGVHSMEWLRRRGVYTKSSQTEEQRGQRSELWLRSFDHAAHEAAGWRVAQPAALLAAGLPIELLQQDFFKSAASVCAHSAAGIPLPSVSELDLNDTMRMWEGFGSLDAPFLVRSLNRGGAVRALAQPETQMGVTESETVPVTRTAQRVADIWSRSWLSAALSNVTVSVGAVPYPSLYGALQDAWDLGRFVNTWMGTAGAPWNISCEASTSSGSLPCHNGVIVPPYVFDPHVLETYSAGSGRRKESALAQLLEDFTPPLLQSTADGRRPHLSQLAVGPPLSGSMLHYHDAAVNTNVVGLKLWILIPPGDAHFRVQPPAVAWFSEVYAGCVPRDPLFDSGLRPLPLQQPLLRSQPHYVALQEPGDVVVVPAHWGHAVLNLADSVAKAESR